MVPEQRHSTAQLHDDQRVFGEPSFVRLFEGRRATVGQAATQLATKAGLAAPRWDLVGEVQGAIASLERRMTGHRVVAMHK